MSAFSMCAWRIDEFGKEEQKVNKCTILSGFSMCVWMVDEFGNEEQKINSPWCLLSACVRG